MQTDKIMQFFINNFNGCDDIKDKTSGRNWIFCLFKGGKNHVKNYGLQFFISENLWNISIGDKSNRQFSIVTA